jgi:hypothetical protein
MSGTKQNLVKKLEEEVSKLRSAFAEEANYRRALEVENRQLEFRLKRNL